MDDIGDGQTPSESDKVFCLLFAVFILSSYLGSQYLKFRTTVLNLGGTYFHFTFIYSQLKNPSLTLKQIIIRA